MREILFRGKRMDNGEWGYGYLVKKRDVDAGLSDFYIVDMFEFSQSSDYCGRIGDCVHSIVPETVGQYTGLNDKKGAKIFEGDIIKLCRYAYDWVDKEESDIEISVVEFENGCFVLDNTYSSDGYNELSCVYDEFSYADGTYEDYVIFEVIGNIHDNPELLGAE